MKINKLILKTLFLYFSIYLVLFIALYLLMPSYFDLNKYILLTFLNTFTSTLIIVSSMCLVYTKSNAKTKSNKNCDIIYCICKNIPFILYCLNIFIGIFITFIFRNKLAFTLSLLSIFASTIFYIFSKDYFKDILHYSENNFREKTISIANIKKKTLFSDIPLSINLIFEILPLIIITLLIGLSFAPLNIPSAIYVIALVLICIIAVNFISLYFYNNINKITMDISSSDNINYNNEFSNLMFRINVTKQVYDDYINQLQNIQNKELEKERLASIEILRRSVDAKDTYTRGHSDRVSEYAVLIGEKLGLSKEDLQVLKIGGLFHDIGKIGIPDKILLKEGKLTDEEYNEIKTHPSIGAHILENSTIFEEMIPIVLGHHERFDGFGYPQKLKGENIPLMARIVAVADTFDAMTSKRSYRNSLPLDVVKSEFERCKSSQFDPNIADIFLDILNNEYEKIEKIRNTL